jgi:hypothetical protein
VDVAAENVDKPGPRIKRCRQPSTTAGKKGKTLEG